MQFHVSAFYLYAGYAERHVSLLEWHGPLADELRCCRTEQPCCWHLHVLLSSLACLLMAHCWAPCQPLLPTGALLLLSLQAVQENAELKRTVEFMMARQAAWAATGPMRGPHPNYEQRRAYAHAPQGMAGVGSQALPAAMGHPFHHQGEPALHVLFTDRTRSTLPRSSLLPACRATASVSGIPYRMPYTSRARHAAQCCCCRARCQRDAFSHDSPWLPCACLHCLCAWAGLPTASGAGAQCQQPPASCCCHS